jgi:hypothetical protein
VNIVSIHKSSYPPSLIERSASKPYEISSDVEGIATVNEHLLESYIPDDGVQNNGEAPWL